MSIHEGSPEPHPFSLLGRGSRFGGRRGLTVWGEGETGAFKRLTLSTLSPAPDAGPFFDSRSAHHRAASVKEELHEDPYR